MIAAHEDEFIGTVRFFDNPGARDLDLARVQFARPCRDLLQVIGSNHDVIGHHPLQADPFPGGRGSAPIPVNC